jgi:hypothetical protein
LATRLTCLLALWPLASGAEVAHYSVRAKIEPAAGELTATVQLQLPREQAGKQVEFLLAAPLQITSTSVELVRQAGEPGQGFQGINGSAAAMVQSGRAQRYRLIAPADGTALTLSYRGKLDFGFETPGQEYARGFSETAGVIRNEGVYLAGSTLWYPYLGEVLFTFDMNVDAPAGWQLISPGTGSAGDENGDATWQVKTPIDELHIVGGPLHRRTRQAGAVSAEVYLRKDDSALAAKYLEATARNLEMYRTLIGPYPYDKFALVENFWETGYGMPSFTLLGPQIIRFPFILTSSYPHEVLHNWWGNGVFVDYASGNWCEGLTAYLADHLYKEQAGSGAEYRRDTLKKYRDFVREAQDFPLTEFRSRHSPATEAVGYGKALMTFHMLRQRVGDAAYVRGLQRFYREQRGKRASFTDLARAHGAAAAVDLDAFMRQWTTREGAPELQLRNVRRMPDGRVTGELRQIQSGAPFSLEVPIVVRTAQGVESFVVASVAATTGFELVPKAQPLALEVDPQFDLFRLLHARETAPSLGQMFGEPRVLAVLPAAAPAAELAAYRKMLEFWSGGGAQQFEIVTDRQLKQLPAEQPVWLFGRDNAWAERSFGKDAAPGFHREADALVLGTARLAFADRSLVVIRRHPRNEMKALGWIALESLVAAEGLARKLPHYGKYSWLGFSGTEPTNTDKGEWSTGDSPLRVDLRPLSERGVALSTGGYARRAALARLPAVFDAQQMQRDIEWLADPAREGRGPGTEGLAAAADFVATAFKQAKLKSVTEVAATTASGNSEGYFQTFAFTPPGARVPIELRNVIGVLPGTDPRFAGEAVLVTAHYDHLGRSGPGVRMSEVGRVHPGADDNASGVAVMLELARAAGGTGLPRTVVFIAFSGEESGLQGSKHFVANAVPVPASGIRSVLNLDTVGRLRNAELSALATDTASEWQHVFRGIGFSTGIAVRNIPGAGQSSDQQSFIEKGIPAVQLFTGAHLDYHRPTDTADRIDLDGLVKVATVAREALEYLAQRPTPLSVTIANVAAPVAASAAPRKVSFGLVPDYAHQGEGVKAESVVPQSPAARAGVQAGDVLLSLDGKPVNGLAAFSEALKAYPVGARVRVVLSRDGQRLALEVVLQER